MFGTQKPWLEVYEGHAEPESKIPEGSLHDLLRNAVEAHREKTTLTVQEVREHDRTDLEGLGDGWERARL